MRLVPGAEHGLQPSLQLGEQLIQPQIRQAVRLASLTRLHQRARREKFEDCPPDLMAKEAWTPAPGARRGRLTGLAHRGERVKAGGVTAGGLVTMPAVTIGLDAGPADPVVS